MPEHELRAVAERLRDYLNQRGFSYRLFEDEPSTPIDDAYDALIKCADEAANQHARDQEQRHAY